MKTLNCHLRITVTQGAETRIFNGDSKIQTAALSIFRWFPAYLESKLSVILYYEYRQDAVVHF
jgi:hypothetical protein